MAREPRDERTLIRQPGGEPARAQPVSDETTLRGPTQVDGTAMRGPPRGSAANVDETALRRPADGTLMRPATGTGYSTGGEPAGPTDSAPSIAADQGHARQPGRPRDIPFGRGYRLRGRYELDEMIGQGAMGQVWRAKDLLGEEALDRNP